MVLKESAGIVERPQKLSSVPLSNRRIYGIHNVRTECSNKEDLEMQEELLGTKNKEQKQISKQKPE